jgi:hypothetical protein
MNSAGQAIDHAGGPTDIVLMPHITTGLALLLGLCVIGFGGPPGFARSSLPAIVGPWVSLDFDLS